MKVRFFKTPSDRFLLLVLIILEWNVSDCSTTTSSNETLSTSRPPTTPLVTTSTTKQAPGNVEKVLVLTKTETSVTLSWEKVNNISTYILEYDHNRTAVNVNNTAGASITHKISDLTPGTKYNFTIFTVLEGVSSSGYTVEAITRPLNPGQIETVTQNETSITLEWRAVKNISSYDLVYNGINITVSPSDGDTVREVVSNLTSMTRYNFRILAVFETIRSSGINHSAVTAPPNIEDIQSIKQNETSITLEWRAVKNISSYDLVYNGINITVSPSDGDKVRQNVSNLTSMTRYNFRILAVFETIRSRGINHSAVTAPRNSKLFKSISQNETSITLQWEKVDAILDYRLAFMGEQMNISSSVNQEQVTHTINGLMSGTKYDFIVFALFENIPSSGTEHTAATVPPMVTAVRVTQRTFTSVTLEWNTGERKDWTYILHFNGETTSYQTNEAVFSHTLSDLQPGTEHSFSVVTSFFEHTSEAYGGSAVTTIDCSGVNWKVTDSSIQAEVEGLFTNATATYESQRHVSDGGSNVSFTGLYPGATYTISLVYEKNSVSLPQCNHNLTIIPPALKAHCEYWHGGYFIKIVWNKPPGVWTAVEVNVSGQTLRTDGWEQQSIAVSGFQPASTYQVSLAAVSGATRRPEPFIFPCPTDPRGVIGGSVMAVLIFGALICIAVFVYYKRPSILRRVMFRGATKQSDKKQKDISAERFASHFHRLSENEDMGFSEEYQDLSPVGTEQTQKVALLSENKPKNRFINIMPYDWCRVKLSKSSPNASDYINASYIPGYNSNREYIATQGPLPATLNDFWQMVWEQEVKGIVMVTNCTEKGRVKCEQYWPAVNKPCLYGDLLVTTVSEEEESNWTLRKFTVKHRHTSEECGVKHFHFTVWPDHGVPLNTQVLIQFRGLVRQHMQRGGASTPTVVHCSAGVGRTGTIIALDVLLQQLQYKKAVGIHSFVHRMRLHRSNMVQTESQYIFLHQCIMDCLQHNKPEESIYENSDMIYVNATALKELNSNA